MTLPYDTCRCASQACPVRETCQRFTDRPKDAMRLSFSDFYDAVQTAEKPCLYFIGEQQ